MSEPWRWSIEKLLGERIGPDLRGGHICSLVQAQGRESQHLEFKRELGSDDKDNFELAKDIAAMANAGGGVIIYGIGDNNGAACEMVPLTRDETKQEQRVYAVAQGRIHPSPRLDVFWVEAGDSSADKGYLMVVVRDSALAPHAVTKDKEYLAYPIRTGTQTTYLTESQIASRYRDRFQLSANRQDRLKNLMKQGLKKCKPDEVYVAVGVVPEQTGSLRLTSSELGRIQEWAANLERNGGLGIPDRPVLDRVGGVVTVGQRHVRIGQMRDVAGADTRISEGWSDGSTFFAKPFNLNLDIRRRFPAPYGGYVVAYDEEIVWLVSAGLKFAALWAGDRCSVGGEALAEIRLCGTGTQGRDLAGLYYVAEHPCKVSDRPDRYPESSEVRLDSIEPASLTVDLDAIRESPKDWFEATMMAVVEIFQAFGIAEPRREPYREWAERNAFSLD